MKNFTFNLPKNPPQWVPAKLQARAVAKLPSHPPAASNFNPPAKPRLLDEIIADIQNGEAGNLTQIEWVYCLYNKPVWDAQHPDASSATSEAIWEAAVSNASLRRRLLWRLALYHILKSNVNNLETEKSTAPPLAPSLIESFSIFAPRAKGDDTLAVQLIRVFAGSQQPASDIAKISWQYTITPKELVRRAGLPARVSAVEAAYERVASLFPAKSTPNKKEAEWLLRCLQQMSPQHQLAAVEELLPKMPAEVAGKMPDVLNFIGRNYSTGSTGSRWHELSDSAKSALRRSLGALNYSYFQQLVNLLARMLRLEDEQIAQLEMRRDFWANYSESIERIRMVLPQSSVSALGYQLQLKVDIIAEEDSDVTEICIFDFGQCFGIEFLRGRGGELRLLPRKPETELILFGPSKMSVKRLRRLGGEVFDRLLFWQTFGEKGLREKKIFPNEGTEYFTGLPRDRGKYSRSNGLPVPSEKEIKERDKQLKQWQKEMEQLEG